MPLFPRRPGTRSSSYQLKTPFPDIATFDAVVRDLILNNRLACVPYRNRRKGHRPVERVREMYTAKFIYTDAKGKMIGRTSEVYDSVEGYETGISAVIANVANREAHRGKIRRVPPADLFSVTLKCHDPGGELYFLNIARDRFTIASYADEAIRKKVEEWADGIPALA